MVLNNVKMINNNAIVQIQIADGIIKAVNDKVLGYKTDHLRLTFEDAIVFPGLINSHDHLDFNLFSQYGNSVYNNYTEWADFIHKNHKQEINAVLKIPEILRAQWGIYKNLLCGITTVVNHGKTLNITNPVIDVIQPSQNLHSVQFEKRWKLKLNNPFKNNQPYCIHIGEGIDALAHSEINELINWNFLNKEIIGIHAVAMNEKQSTRFKAIVWCPDSNHFILERTAKINELKHNTSIVFGTDSTLTADWNIWNHIRLARRTGMATDKELFDMLTVTPSAIWKKNCGEIKKENDADIVVAQFKNIASAIDAFYKLNPEDILLVIKNGIVKLFDEQLKEQLLHSGFDLSGFGKIKINNATKYVSGNLSALVDGIKKHYAEADFPFAVL